jgi:tetratricopeptide (TPR) repeat protein
MSCKPSRSIPCSLVCSTLAVVLGAAPSLPAHARTLAIAPEAGDEAAPAEGDPEALSAAAVERFQAKEYDAAVELFEQAYAADPQPNYLFNIGRVYEEKGDLENAVVYYQRFVGQSGVDLESRQAATERLKVLRETLAQMKGEEPKDDPQPKDDGTTKPTGETPVTTDEGDDGAKRKKTLRITGYALMGAGGVGLILGGVFGGLARGNANDSETDPFVDRQEALRERARTQARVADAMFITGGVLAAAGLVLVLTTLGGKNKKADAKQARWSPVVGPQQVGVGFSRRF